MTDELILVDTNDNQIGCEEKFKVHQKGLLHRCFSIIIINPVSEILLQKRAAVKYHSPGLWTNTCCGHPCDGEETRIAAYNRLKQEMGFGCQLKELLSFVYRAELDNGLFEHEFDHVFAGVYSGNLNPDPAEVEDYKWVTLDFIRKDLDKNPAKYSAWFPLIVKNLDTNIPNWMAGIT